MVALVLHCLALFQKLADSSGISSVKSYRIFSSPGVFDSVG